MDHGYGLCFGCNLLFVNEARGCALGPMLFITKNVSPNSTAMDFSLYALFFSSMIRIYLCMLLLCHCHVAAQSINGPITENVSLLDSGLTTLAAISTIIVTLVRRRLDAEIGLRQCQNESLTLSRSVLSQKGVIHFGSFELIDAIVLTPKPYWNGAIDFCKYAANNHSLTPCMILVISFMELGVEHSGQCQRACSCIASHYVQELEPLVALAYGASIRVHSLQGVEETDPDRDWYVYQCKSCIGSNCHDRITRELHIPEPVPLDLQEVTRYEEDSLGEAVEQDNELFSSSNQTLVLPVRRWNRARIMTMLGLSLEGMDAVNRNRMHSLTSALRLPDYRISEELTAAWEGSIYYIYGVHACELLLNVFLVLVFRIDPMSSALAARRALRGFVVDSTGSSVTLGEYLQAARVIKGVGLVEGVVQMRVGENARTYKIMRLIPAAGNVLRLILWSVMILLGKHPIRWTGGYEAVLPNWGLYVLTVPCILSIISSLVAWHMLIDIVYSPKALFEHVLLLSISALIILAEITTALRYNRFHMLRRAVQVSLAWLSFLQWRLGTYMLGPGGPDQSPPEIRATLIYSHTFVVTGFLAGIGGI